MRRTVFLNRTGLLVLGAVLCLMLTATWTLAGAQQSADDPDNVVLKNDYIMIFVNKRDENTGRFAVRTTGGDPERAEDNDESLIYGNLEPKGPWTSYTTVRVDGENYVFGGRTEDRSGKSGPFGTKIQAPILGDEEIVTSWSMGPIEVSQVIGFARSSTTGLFDTARISYTLSNPSDTAHEVGLRVVIDTMLGNNDGAPFRMGERALTGDARFEGADIPDFWQAFDSLADPRVMAQGTLRGADVTVPDRVDISNWGSLADGPWDFDFQPGRKFIRAGEFEYDTAMALYWMPRRIGPGEAVTYVMHYGLGGINIAPGDLTIGLTSPATVAAPPSGPTEFPVLAYIQNTGKGEARDVKAAIDLPDGMKLAAGQRQERSLGGLAVGSTAQVRWRVLAQEGVRGELTYKVRVRSENSEPNQGERSISIVAPARLSIKIDEPDVSLRVVDGQWAPVPYTVKAEVTNEGETDAYSVTTSLEDFIGLDLAQGDLAVKPRGTLAPGESVGVQWALVPEGNVGHFPYNIKASFFGSKDEVRRPGFVDVPPLKAAVKIRTVSVSRPARGADGRLEMQEVPPTEARVGDIVLVEVMAYNIPAFAGASWKLRYDSSMVSPLGGVLGIERGQLFVDDTNSEAYAWDTPVIESTGSQDGIAFQAWRGSEPAQGPATGSLARIRFLVKGSGVVRLAADVYPVDGDREPLKPLQAEHEITVSEAR